MKWLLLLGGIVIIIAFWLFLSPGQEPSAPAEDLSQSEAESPATSPDDQDTLNAGTVQNLDIFRSEDDAKQIVLTDLTGTGASGSAYLLFTDEAVHHAVIASLPVLTDGQVYEGWLVDPSQGEFFSTGVMTYTSTDSFELYYESADPDPRYSKVVITQETVVDETPEEHVLEGLFE